MIARVPEFPERATFLDRPAALAVRVVDAALERVPRRDLLHGKWLGHTVHPPLTDLPIGFWTASFVLDFVPLARVRPVADSMVALGVVTALPTAATGLADFSGTDGPARRVAFVHGIANSAALFAYIASLVNRVRGRRRRAVVQGLLGATAATVAGQLGGHLIYRLGTGVVVDSAETATSEASAARRPAGSSPR